MAKEVVKYQCEHCLTLRDSLADTESCESRHYSRPIIIKAEYLKGSDLPTSFHVEMFNSTESVIQIYKTGLKK